MSALIRDLCIRAICDVDGIKNPDTHRMYIPDCFRDRFTELIVQECANVVNSLTQHESQGDCNLAESLKEHFGY